MNRSLHEFAQLEGQLSGVELYAMKYLEAENAEVTAERLRKAEASISTLYSLNEVQSK